MSRAEFMEKLEYLLQDLSQEDGKTEYPFTVIISMRPERSGSRKYCGNSEARNGSPPSSGAIYKWIWKTAAFLARMGLKMSVSGSLGTRW